MRSRARLAAGLTSLRTSGAIVDSTAATSTTEPVYGAGPAHHRVGPSADQEVRDVAGIRIERVASGWVVMAAAGLTWFGPAAAGSTVPGDVGGLVPPGDYRTRPLTRDELIPVAVAAGFQEADVTPFIDEVLPTSESTVTIGLIIEDDGWTNTVSFDGRPDDFVAPFTIREVDSETLIAIEPCGELTLRYEVDEGAVSFDVVEDQCTDPIGSLVHVLNFESAPFVPVPEQDGSAVTLRFTYLGDSAGPELVAFADEVSRLSGGEIDFVWVPVFDPTYETPYPTTEADILVDVADSTVDLGMVGLRALGGFDALLAPLLIDSHALEQQVFEAGIPERMLAELDEAGLVGITAIPGPLRRLLGVEHDFASPADFEGATIAGDHTELTRATMNALGATEVPGRVGLPLDEVDAVVAHFGAVLGNQYETQADSVVANVNLWPRPLAIVINNESFESLTPEQQDVLVTAGANTFDPAMKHFRTRIATQARRFANLPSTSSRQVTRTSRRSPRRSSPYTPTWKAIHARPTTSRRSASSKTTLAHRPTHLSVLPSDSGPCQILEDAHNGHGFSASIHEVPFKSNLTSPTHLSGNTVPTPPRRATGRRVLQCRSGARSRQQAPVVGPVVAERAGSVRSLV